MKKNRKGTKGKLKNITATVKHQLFQLRMLEVRCPCCQGTKLWKETTLEHPLTKLYFASVINELATFVKSIQKEHFDDWMCNDCYYKKEKKGTALMADWEKQDRQGPYTWPSRPTLIYQTKNLYACNVCKDENEFTAGEQQFWYEKAIIPIDFRPKMCKRCRNESKRVNAIALPLGDLMRQAKKNPTAALYTNIAAAYLELNNRQKAGVYQQKAKFFRKKEH